MGFTTPDFPDVDPEQFLAKPLMERMRILALNWAANGFGSPRTIHTVYITKLVFFYALGAILVATLTSGLPAFWHVSAWWNQPIVYELDRDRITVREIEKLGRSAIDSNELFIEDLEVGDDEVVDQVGQGFTYLIDGLNSERIVVSLEGVGIGQAALELAAKHANERVVFDRPIGQNQAVAHPLTDSWIRLESARLMAMHAATITRTAASRPPRPSISRRGRLRCLRPGHVHPRRLRLREGIPRRAAVAGGTVAPQRAAIAGDDAQLDLHPSAQAAPRLLTRRPARRCTSRREYASLDRAAGSHSIPAVVHPASDSGQPASRR